MTLEKIHADPSAPLSIAWPMCPLEPRLVINSVSESALPWVREKVNMTAMSQFHQDTEMQSVTA